MKRYFTYILSFVLISCIAACTKSEDVVNPNAEGHMALRLVSSTMTRATTSGNGVGVGENDDNLKEDKLVSADLYFFDGEGAGNAVWHHREIFSNTREKAEITELTIPSNIVSAIFNTNTSQATLYVVANAPADTLPTYEGLAEGETLPTMAELKAYTISTPSWKTSSTPSSAQSSFVMDGEDKITKTNNEIGGTVALTRAAAKIELSITDVVSSVTVGDETWTPVLGDNDNGSTILVSLNYAVGGSYINGAYNKTLFANDNTQQNYGFARDAAVTDKKAYNQAHPFYSYASDWGAAGGANEPYLLLVVPWISSKPGTSQQNTFYQIPVGSLDDKQIKRNHYYKVKINVGTMGSFEPQTATEITPSYTVIDWSTGSITTDIKEARYLVVDENEIEIFNQTDCAISYASSHPVTATIDSIVFNSYKLANTRKIKITSSAKTITPTASNLSIADVYTDYDLSYGTVNGAQSITTLPKGNATFGFTHAIPTYYTPRTIYVTVQHTGDESFSEQVKIIQYPPIYFVGEKATGRVYVNEQYTEDDNRISVYDDDRNDIGSVRDPSTVVSDDDATNMNENNYDIHVTVLPSGSKWQIGDPRETTGTTLSGIDELTKYRKTRTDAVNVIAPVFKIASSRGKTTTMSFTNAIKRCASYQENGFPAGRWRVPTPAEIEFIVSRSADGDIPSLFDGEYWAANGQYFDSDDKKLHTTSNDQSVRCVYDVWYWGEDNIKGALNTPVWGDAKNNATLNAENPVN